MNKNKPLAKLIVGLAVSAAAIGATACGDSKSSKEPRAPTPQPSVSLSGKERLARRGTPGATVLRLWRYLQVGAIPPAALLYAKDVRENLGIADLAGALSLSVASVVVYRPTIVSVERTPGGSLVILRAVSKTGVSPQYAYVLRRKGGKWVITYDSLLEPALKNYVIAKVRLARNEKQKQPSIKARRAGEAVAEVYRLATLVGKKGIPAPLIGR